jgi:hypothetical protein
LKKAVVKKRFASSTKLRPLCVNAKTQRMMTRKPICAALRRAGLISVKVRRVPKLTADQKRRRLEFCQERAHDADWVKDWIWTDEKWFEVGGVQGNEHMWVEATDPDPDERYVGKSAHPTKVHVWGAISYTGRSSIHIHVGNIDSQVYIDCIEEALLPSLYDPEYLALDKRKKYTFQYDGASCHSSRLTLEWLKAHLPRNISALRKGEWPANSPDLNPIETLWNILQDAVIEKQAETPEELEKAVLDAWWAIPVETIQKLIDGVVKKVRTCIEREGGRTNTR